MSLISEWPLEDSSGPAVDVKGNNDGTVNGATPDGGAGPFGADVFSFDGADDYVDAGGPVITTTGEFSISTWVKWDGTNGNNQFVVMNGDNTSSGYGIVLRGGSNDVIAVLSGGTGWTESSTQLSTGTWQFVVATRESSSYRMFLDGSELSLSNQHNPSTPDQGTFIGGISGFSESFNGDMADVRIYDHALTPNEIQYLYDASTTGTIYTATKTHGATVSPDVRADVTLNTESATMYVIGSPRSASQEVKQVALSDGMNDYTLSWSNGHTDFAVRIVADLSDLTNRVTVNKVALLN